MTIYNEASSGKSYMQRETNRTVHFKQFSVFWVLASASRLLQLLVIVAGIQTVRYDATNSSRLFAFAGVFQVEHCLSRWCRPHNFNAVSYLANSQFTVLQMRRLSSWLNMINEERSNGWILAAFGAGSWVAAWTGPLKTAPATDVSTVGNLLFLLLEWSLA
jgi:hypothetical protein